jgi:hypothetical protein
VPQHIVIVPTLLLGIVFSAFAQQPPRTLASQAKPAPAPLFFREEWKSPTSAPENIPVTQAAIASPNLELRLYGASAKNLNIVREGLPPNDPLHVWTGVCESACGVTFREKNNYVDLTGLAKIRWYGKVSGFHQYRPLVKLADGTFLVGDHADGSTVDFQESEFWLLGVRWLKLDIPTGYTKGEWVANPDLSRVDEVGFVDLLPGSGHGPGGYSDVGWIEVYGKPVKRDASGASREPSEGGR